MARPKTPICHQTEEAIQYFVTHLGSWRVSIFCEVNRSTVSRWASGNLAVPPEKLRRLLSCACILAQNLDEHAKKWQNRLLIHDDKEQAAYLNKAYRENRLRLDEAKAEKSRRQLNTQNAD